AGARGNGVLGESRKPARVATRPPRRRPLLKQRSPAWWLGSSAQNAGAGRRQKVRVFSCPPTSSGEKHIVAFLLTVYNPDQDLVPPFRAIDAILVWDDRHRKAFAAWVSKPFTL